MDLDKFQSMRCLLKGLRRPNTEYFPAASVAEAIEMLIECCEFILDSIQPDRLNPRTSIEDAIVKTSDESGRGRSEEVSPPDDPFKCSKCESSFDPSDWQNDICDNCLYGRNRS